MRHGYRTKEKQDMFQKSLRKEKEMKGNKFGRTEELFISSGYL